MLDAMPLQLFVNGVLLAAVVRVVSPSGKCTARLGSFCVDVTLCTMSCLLVHGRHMLGLSYLYALVTAFLEMRKRLMNSSLQMWIRFVGSSLMYKCLECTSMASCSVLLSILFAAGYEAKYIIKGLQCCSPIPCDDVNACA